MYAVAVIENHLLFVICRHFRVKFSKRLLDSCARLQNYTIDAPLAQTPLVRFVHTYITYIY